MGTKKTFIKSFIWTNRECSDRSQCGWGLVELWLCLRQPGGGGLSRSWKVTSAWLEVNGGSERPLLQGPQQTFQWLRTCHQDGTGLPLQAGWAGGVSSPHWDDADTSRTRGKKEACSRFCHRQWLAWDAVSSPCWTFTVQAFLGLFDRLFFKKNKLPNTSCPKSKSLSEDGGRAAEISGSLLWQYLCWVFQQLSGAKTLKNNAILDEVTVLKSDF